MQGQVWAFYDYMPQQADTLRPPWVLRMGASTGFRFYWLTLNLQVVSSSEDRFHPFATSMYGIQPAWSWGRLYFGDFTPTFSPLVLSGLVIRGYGVDLYPGAFRLFAVAGQARVPELDTVPQAPTRWVQGFLLGMRRGIRVELLRVEDRGRDSMSLTPQANLVAAVALRFHPGPLAIKGFVTGAVHTYDATLKAPWSLPVSRILRRVGIPVNQSSHVDYGYQVETEFRHRGLRIQGRRLYVGPGYRTLGVPSLKVDREENTLGAGFSLLSQRLNGTIQLTWSRNNLQKTQEATSRGRQEVVSASVLVSRSLQGTAGWNGFSQVQDLGDTLGTQKTRNEMFYAGVVLRARWKGRNFTQRITLNHSRFGMSLLKSRRHRTLWGGTYRLQVQPLAVGTGLALNLDHQVLADTGRNPTTRWGLQVFRDVGSRVRFRLLGYQTVQRAHSSFGVEVQARWQAGVWGTVQVRLSVQQTTKNNPGLRFSVRYQRAFR